MNVQIRNIDSGRKSLLETDKIVHVKVLERKGGNAAVIEVNGYRTEAQIEADAPDNFLAFAELGAGAADAASVKLRVLSSFRNTREFGDYSRQKVIDGIKMFLLENNLPMDPEFFESALLLRSAGIKLNAAILKMLHYAARKSGEDMVQVLVGFMKKGAVLDAEFIDLFSGLRQLLRTLLKQKNGDQNPPEEEAAAGKKRESLSNLSSLLDRFLGGGSGYRAFLLEESDGEILVQFRIGKGTDRERFYFELSGEKIGEVLLVIDRTNDSYRATVYMNRDLYRETEERINAGREKVRSELQKKVPDRKLILEFSEIKNSLAFWDDGESNDGLAGNDMFNLDISV